MTSRERSDLQQLARMNARVAKADVDAVAAQRLAEFEEALARDWTAQELQVEELVAEANLAAKAVNDRIRARCEELDIRPELRPRMLNMLMTSPRANRAQEGELRRKARTRLDALAKRAKTEIDRQTAAVCTEIVVSSLESEEARDLLTRVSSPEALVPTLSLEELEAGDRR